MAKIKLVECIPNFSEGRNTATLEALRRVAQSVPGTALLDYSADKDHNRSVFTLAGEPKAVEKTAFLLVAEAATRIDLSTHSGEHPRMGATDVLPFVPLRSMEMEDCIAMSRRVAKRIGEELSIPVFLYERSATSQNRRNLADIRRSGFEGMARKMLLPEWAPDFGPSVPHPMAGVMAVGARGILIAFNVNLATPNIEAANAIAKAVRASSGGLPAVKAIGVMLKSRNVAQVSMNLVDYETTPVWQAFEAVRDEAQRRGIVVLGSELVGLAPARAFADTAAHFLQLEQYTFEQQMLENHFW